MDVREYWRWVVGYEGHYKVSDLGRVRSVDRTIPMLDGRQRTSKGRILSLFKHKNNHIGVTLYKHGHKRTHWVHRLVLEAFVGPCPPGMECRHFPDGDPTNNCLKNLSWATHLKNMWDVFIHGTRNSPCGELHSASKLTEGEVKRIRQLHNGGQSLPAIAKTFGVTAPTIWAIVHRHTWRHV